MTESQKETLRFYTTNDYLLINGLLWGEDEQKIDIFINLINEDGRAVMAEAPNKAMVFVGIATKKRERDYTKYIKGDSPLLTRWL